MNREVYGLDLGSYEIKIYDKNEDRIWKAKNAAAITTGHRYCGYGDDAYAMFEKAPAGTEVIFPMENGVISHFEHMQYVLKHLIRMERRFPGGGGEYLIAVPTDVTEVEKKAFYDLVCHSGARARSVRIVERGIADAVGMGADIVNEQGILVVNCGAETTEISVLSENGMVVNRLVKTGGNKIDASIVTSVRKEMDFLIGRTTAELLRKNFGIIDAFMPGVKVAGRDLITGVPRQEIIGPELIRRALKEPLLECVQAIQTILERTPPIVRKAAAGRGILLSGGQAKLPGLKEYLEEQTRLKVSLGEDSEFCAVKGLKKIILNPEYTNITYSMTNEDYRWLR